MIRRKPVPGRGPPPATPSVDTLANSTFLPMPDEQQFFYDTPPKAASVGMPNGGPIISVDAIPSPLVTPDAVPAQEQPLSFLPYPHDRLPQLYPGSSRESPQADIDRSEQSVAASAYIDRKPLRVSSYPNIVRGKEDLFQRPVYSLPRSPPSAPPPPYSESTPSVPALPRTAEKVEPSKQAPPQSPPAPGFNSTASTPEFRPRPNGPPQLYGVICCHCRKGAYALPYALQLGLTNLRRGGREYTLQEVLFLQTQYVFSMRPAASCKSLRNAARYAVHHRISLWKD